MDNKSIDIYKSALELNKNDNNINYNLATSLRKVESIKKLLIIILLLAGG